MSSTLDQLLVGVAFQPRKNVALNSSLFHRGWKAAPTEITPSLKLMTLGPAIPEHHFAGAGFTTPFSGAGPVSGFFFRNPASFCITT